MSDTDAAPDAGPEPSKLWLLALLVVVFVAYSPTLGNGFALDDKTTAMATLPSGAPNPMVAEIQPLAAYFTSGYWGGNTGTKSNLYRPVTVLSYAVTNAWFGPGAFAHHLLNVLLHVWAVFLAFQLLTRLSIRRFAALVGSAVFGLHAIHSEVVAGIVGRAELLSFCLGAQALLLVSSAASKQFVRMAAGGTLLFLAYCSKESALAWAPFLVVFVITDDLIRQRPVQRGRVVTALAISLPPLLVFAFLRDSAVGDITPAVHYYANPLAHVDTLPRILSAVMVWGYGLLLCAFPFHLLSDYGPVNFDLVESLGDFRFLISLLALIAVLVTGLAAARRHPPVFLAMACFLGFGLATSNVLFPIGTIFGERLYFAPSLAVGILVAWGLSDNRSRWVYLELAVWLACCVVVILLRNGAWASDVELFASDVNRGTHSVRVLDQRAAQLRNANENDEAEKLWRRAIELDPEYADGLFNFASYLGAAGRFDEAEAQFLAAIAVPAARSGRRHIYRRDLSVLYELTRRKALGVEQLRLAWLEDSAFEEIWEPLVERTVNQLPTMEIERIVTTGEQRASGHATWPFLRGILAYRTREFPAAVDRFRTALDLRPGHAWTRLELGRSLLAAGRRVEGTSVLRALASDTRAPDRFRRPAAQLLR